MKTLLLAALLAQAMPAPPPPEMPQVQIPQQKPLIPQAPLPPPDNLKNWPVSCQRLHQENNRCENGLKSCNQRRVDYWRKKCERDEPHGQ